MLKKLYWSAATVAVLFLLVACGASKKNHENRLLVQGIDSAGEFAIKLPEPLIKKGDLLTIMIYSDNKEATEVFNQPQTGGSAGVANATGTQLNTLGRGYLVDQQGLIQLHTLGSIKAEGETRLALAEQLKTKLLPYLKNPFVIIRFANQRVTVLGEVTRPGVIELPDNRVSIFDAIGFAGDFTAFGRRDNVLLVREKDGKRTAHRIDLRNSSVYTSDFYYLQSNDMVYIEPSRRKPTGNEQVLLRNVTIGSSIVSVLVLIISLIRR
ncbi:polysaccharide biosynthesis/export family protein [Flavihumibacter sp. CACIAM 22H1]|uniref:polysaccharide biosynthesis/export family protein n=1 Tax=Flavihumibacter sp. CACIAM 22H1 TaxID=1812911 RepID=UPI0007A8BE0D|nr:polysaccharide biosynthesis/export family protein [Flavihumibacter sp. CACIAM 22H1]KYP13241.1 MAG: hypothetical protein A1D16_05820 [Flavihumibacter sp. CACIAM 22H1]